MSLEDGRGFKAGKGGGRQKKPSWRARRDEKTKPGDRSQAQLEPVVPILTLTKYKLFRLWRPHAHCSTKNVFVIYPGQNSAREVYMFQVFTCFGLLPTKTNTPGVCFCRVCAIQARRAIICYPVGTRDIISGQVSVARATGDARRVARRPGGSPEAKKKAIYARTYARKPRVTKCV